MLQPISETPVVVSPSAQAAFSGLPIYRKLLVAEQDPQRSAYFRAALNHATDKMGLAYGEALLYAKQAASVWTWATAPYRGGKPNPYVQNVGSQFGFAQSLLSYEDWLYQTGEIVQVARKARPAINDLMSRGLTMPLPDIGVYQVEWQKFTDLEPAVASMSLQGNMQRDQGQFSRESVPVPIIHKDFRFDIRDILASRRGGAPLDTTHGSIAAQLVSEKAEQILMNGDSTIVFQSSTLYGYTTHPSTLTETTSKDFGTASNITDKFALVIAALRLKNHTGPFVVYLHPTQYGEMKAPRTTTDSTTMMEFTLKQHPEIEAIRESQWVTAATGVVVEMNRATVDLAIAQDVTTVQWDDPDGSGVNMRVMMAVTPRIKADAAGQTGVLYMTNI